ncbi:MAG: helix-turn-helix transcriptional regulator [Oscillospiraceae bacterium]|nr:helix-turn-helix transcriptional regulator [Oscillospiraceae bacterium]
MELGEKIRQARLELGLSQRQLCGDVITRNMLSQIENGSANPSMSTLQYLAGQLGKPISYFLQEETVLSPNLRLLQNARQAYAKKQYREMLDMNDLYQSPDPLFDEEWHYLCALCALALAEQRIAQGDWTGAESLLENVHRGSIYYRVDMERRRKQLLLQVYENLELYCREQEDFKRAYEYACKLRSFQM